MRKIIIYILFTIAFSCKAQVNLVPNGSFEEYNLQPTTFLPFFKDARYLKIEDILPGWKAPTNGTSDVFIIKNPKVPNDAVDYPIRWDQYSGTYDQYEYVQPSNGLSFVGLISGILIDTLTNTNLIGQEFIQTEFSELLNPNSKYRLEIDHRISQSSNSSYPKLGIHLSKDSISNYYATSINNPNFTRFVPPIADYSNLNTSATFWQTYSLEFRPNDTYRYLTIGCFNLECHPFTNDTSFSSYYFIDDVSLIEIPCIVGQDTACKGEQVTYYSTFVGPFSWEHNGVEVSTDSIYTFTAYKGWYHLKTLNGEDSLYLTVLDELQNITDVNDTICAGETATIDLRSQYQYVWEDGNTSVKRIFTDPTSQYVQVFSNHCSDTLNVNIRWYPQTTSYPNFLYQFCRDSFAYVEHRVGTLDEEVLWSDGFIGGVRKLYDEGNYTYDIIDSNGCLNGGIVSVEEICPAKYWVPNAFAPDGINKTFKPYLKDISEATLTIYNRWGEKIYEQTTQEPEWDGTYQNTHCQQGVYFYTLTLKSEKNNIIDNLKGVIHLIR